MSDAAGEDFVEVSLISPRMDTPEYRQRCEWQRVKRHWRQVTDATYAARIDSGVDGIMCVRVPQRVHAQWPRIVDKVAQRVAYLCRAASAERYENPLSREAVISAPLDDGERWRMLQCEWRERTLRAVRAAFDAQHRHVSVTVPLALHRRWPQLLVAVAGYMREMCMSRRVAELENVLTGDRVLRTRLHNRPARCRIS